LYRFRKEGGELQAEALEPTYFVPMTGTAEDRRGPSDESGIPELINGDFEAAGDPQQPTGWYYARQAEVVTAVTAGQGERYLRLRNTTPGRSAQVLQAVALDGRKVKHLDLSLMLATREVRPGQSSQELPRVGLNFFDQRRALLGTEQLGTWTGTTRWTKQQARINVPSHCRLAVLYVSMYGAVGELSVDQLSLRVIDE
jgi:protein-L-isoaspartate(D-aspartate) O-methyltransferase